MSKLEPAWSSCRKDNISHDENDPQRRSPNECCRREAGLGRGGGGSETNGSDALGDGLKYFGELLLVALQKGNAETLSQKEESGTVQMPVEASR
jgi:hypothetical protein